MVFSHSERTSALLPDSAALEGAFASLPEWRRRKAAALRFEADRRRSVAAWLLLRRMLSELGVDAVSDGEVGCDVERIVPAGDDVLKASLAGAELLRVAALSGGARDRAFTRLWVRKESYAKAVGRGLGIDPSTFSALDSPPSSGWTWQDFDFGDGHLGCVCAMRMEGANFGIIRGHGKS